jgi:hypothetical protein
MINSLRYIHIVNRHDRLTKDYRRVCIGAQTDETYYPLVRLYREELEDISSKLREIQVEFGIICRN